MKNKICFTLAFVNLVSIGLMVYFTNVVYLQVYNTVLFWGINLYVLTASCIMLVNQKNFSVMIPVNIGLTILSIFWFIYYMPEFTPVDALKYVKSNSYLQSSYSYSLDEDKPVQRANVNNFVKGVYRIRAYGSEDYVVYVNPVSGEFEYFFLKNDITKSAFFNDETTNLIDLEYIQSIKTAKNTAMDLSQVLLEYSLRWKAEMENTFYQLFSICNEENKQILLDDQNEWGKYIKGHENMQLHLYAQNYENGDMMEILKYDIPYTSYRQRALKLKTIYKKFTKEIKETDHENNGY